MKQCNSAMAFGNSLDTVLFNEAHFLLKNNSNEKNASCKYNFALFSNSSRKK